MSIGLSWCSNIHSTLQTYDNNHINWHLHDYSQIFSICSWYSILCSTNLYNHSSINQFMKVICYCIFGASSCCRTCMCLWILSMFYYLLVTSLSLIVRNLQILVSIVFRSTSNYLVLYRNGRFLIHASMLNSTSNNPHNT